MPIKQFGGFTDADLRGCPLCSNRFYSWQPRSILSKVNPERLVHRTWRDLQLVSPCFAAFNDSTTILTPPALEFLKASKELVQLKIRHECLEYTYNTIGKPWLGLTIKEKPPFPLHVYSTITPFVIRTCKNQLRSLNLLVVPNLNIFS